MFIAKVPLKEGLYVFVIFVGIHQFFLKKVAISLKTGDLSFHYSDITILLLCIITVIFGLTVLYILNNLLGELRAAIAVAIPLGIAMPYSLALHGPGSGFNSSGGNTTNPVPTAGNASVNPGAPVAGSNAGNIAGSAILRDDGSTTNGNRIQQD